MCLPEIDLLILYPDTQNILHRPVPCAFQATLKPAMTGVNKVPAYDNLCSEKSLKYLSGMGASLAIAHVISFEDFYQYSTLVTFVKIFNFCFTFKSSTGMLYSMRGLHLSNYVI